MVHIALVAAGVIVGAATLAPAIASARGGHGGHGGHGSHRGGHAGHGHAGGHGHRAGGHAGLGLSRFRGRSGGIRSTGGSISTYAYGYYSCRRWIPTP